MKVLIVDDSKAIFMMVSAMLKEKNHISLWAQNGKEAIEFLKKEGDLKIILLDWNMPVMSGPEFLEEYSKQKLSNVPIIMMTTENKPDNIRKALSLGASEYIMKPFTSDILFDKIGLVLE